MPFRFKRNERKLTPETARMFFYTPAQSARLLGQYTEARARHPGIQLGIRSMDEKMLPMVPGDVVGFISRPGHGKTTVSACVAKNAANQLVRQGRNDEIIVYVTFEQVVEEIESLFQADENLSVTEIVSGRASDDDLKYRALSRPKLPVWLMGKSIVEHRDMPRMTIGNIFESLLMIEDEFKKKAALIILDYLQIIPLDNNESRMDQVAEAIGGSKELAQTIACPVIFNVQAARAVDSREEQIPTASDCQWSSAIEQAADKLFGFWRPWLTAKDRTKTLRYNGTELKITPNLFISKCLKQRFAVAGDIFVSNFEPQFVKLSDMEVEGQIHDDGSQGELL